MTVKDCEHDVLKEWLSVNDRSRDLVESIRCPGCSKCFRPVTDGYNQDWYLKETVDPREWIVGATDERKLMGADELREHLQEKSKEHVGTTDLEEGNRRYAVLHEWRYDP